MRSKAMARGMMFGTPGESTRNRRGVLTIVLRLWESVHKSKNPDSVKKQLCSNKVGDNPVVRHATTHNGYWLKDRPQTKLCCNSRRALARDPG